MKGLTQKEVEILQKKFWKNTITSKWWNSALKIFLIWFKDPLSLLLILAVFISFLIWEYLDWAIILIVIFINSTIWFIQEYKAEKWIEALKKIIPQSVKVKRDWVFIEIATEEIVPWDIVEVFQGNKIPADWKIIETNEFKIDEAILTWESIPKEKKSWEVFMWTIAIKWKALIEIQKIWMETKFWKIAELTTETKEEKSPLQKEMVQLAKYLWIIVIIICVLIFLITIFRNWTENIIDALIYSIAIAVAAVPEWLATTMTITLAIWAKVLMSKNAVIKKLWALETLWAVTYICTDKTWTLTKNEMTVVNVFVNWEIDLKLKNWEKNKDFEELIKCGYLCNESSLENKNWKIKIIWDPTEWCLLVLAKKKWINYEEKIKELKFIKTLSFDSERKMMTSIFEENWKKTAYIKWALEQIINKCNYYLKNWEKIKITEKYKKEILEIEKKYQEKALRVLWFEKKEILENEEISIKNTENNLIFIWITWIIDPPRDDIKDAIKTTKKAWIKVIMITWDAKNTALAIAKKIWLFEWKNYKLFSWEEIAKIKDKEFIKILHSKIIPIFARVSPFDKRRIVKLLQDNWEIVAVTWDWVNDAPALKKASIWVAMWITGSDIAKEASKLILLNDSYSSIIYWIEEWRRIKENMKKFIFYSISTNAWELFVIIFALLFWFLNPLTPVLILVMNLATDIFPALSLWLEKIPKWLMEKSPEKWEKIINWKFITEVLITWIYTWITWILIFIHWINYSYEYWISACFWTLIIIQMFKAYSSKNREKSIFSWKNTFNPYLNISIFLWFLSCFLIIQTNFWNEIFSTQKLFLNTWFYILFSWIWLILVEEIRKFLIKK